MTELLKKAFEEISALPAEEQDAWARELLERLAEEQEWDRLTGQPGSAEWMEKQAEKAFAEHRAGKTRPFPPKQ